MAKSITQPLRSLYQVLREGSVQAEQLFHEAQAAYEATEDQYQAYKTWNGAQALESARFVDQLLAHGVDLGPLMGLPISIKDMYAVRGLPTFAGSPMPLGTSWEEPGPLMHVLEQQQAIISGKTHTVEFAFSGIGMNRHWGTPWNPSDPNTHRIPGGSSSGAGVSLAQGSACLAFGTDTAGSVRVPASMTGMTGLKMTQGRWPLVGVVPLSTSLDSPGLLARRVDDLRFAFEAIEQSFGQIIPSHAPPHPSQLRIGRVDRFFMEDIDDSIASVFEAALQRLAQEGASVQQADIPGCEEAYGVFQQGGLAAPELCAFLKANHPEHMERLDPAVRMRMEGVQSLSAVDYLLRKETLKRTALQGVQAFEDFDVLVMPTVVISPPTIEELEDPAIYKRTNMLILRNTGVANLLGFCALTLPIGHDHNGMPVGLQLLCRGFEEEKLLAIAQTIETVVRAS